MSVQLLPLTKESLETVVQEQGPGLPTLSTLERHEKMSGNDTVLHRVAAVTPTGRMVGYGLAVGGSWDPVLLPGHFELRVQVEPQWRGRGVGRAILAEIERFAHNHGAVALEVCIGDGDEDGLAWADRLGYKKVQHMFTSELDLTQFDPAPFATSLAAAERAGFQFTSLADYPDTEETFLRFYDLYWDLALDAPGMAGRPRMEIDEFRSMLHTVLQWKPAWVILAVKDKDWAGFAFIHPRNQTTYYNNLTGVKPEYRGNGLALGLKLQSIAYARSQGALLMTTDNDSNNQPMLAVNRKLGFKPKPGRIWLRRML